MKPENAIQFYLKLPGLANPLTDHAYGKVLTFQPLNE